MDLKTIKRTQPRKKYTIVNIRLTQEESQWLREKDYSPTAILHEALKDLGFKAGTKVETKRTAKPSRKKKR